MEKGKKGGKRDERKQQAQSDVIRSGPKVRTTYDESVSVEGC